VKPVLVDTGPLVALISRRDGAHVRCCEAARQIHSPLLTTWLVLAEAAWLLRRDRRDIDRLMQTVEDGDVQPVPLDRSAAAWVRRFLDRYADLSPQVADASLMYLAETLGCDEVFTLDRRDFSVFRRENGDPLRIVPE